MGDQHHIVLVGMREGIRIHAEIVVVAFARAPGIAVDMGIVGIVFGQGAVEVEAATASVVITGHARPVGQ